MSVTAREAAEGFQLAGTPSIELTPSQAAEGFPLSA
jgi:hypothetical protein